MTLKLYALLAVLGIIGGGGLFAWFRRDQQSIGELKQQRKNLEEDGRRKDAAIENLQGQLGTSVPDDPAADRVWDALRKIRPER